MPAIIDHIYLNNSLFGKIRLSFIHCSILIVFTLGSSAFDSPFAQEAISEKKLRHFYAGNYQIHISEVVSGDLMDFSGKGYLVSDDSSFFEYLNFRHLLLEERNDRVFLKKGEINVRLETKASMMLTPEISTNGVAHFLYSQVKINASGVALLGQLKWDFPLKVESGGVPFLFTKESWVKLNAFKLDGVLLPMGEKRTWGLKTLTRGELTLENTSKFYLKAGQYGVSLNGFLSLPLRNSSDDLQDFRFKKVNNLADFTESKYQHQAFLIVPHLNLSIHPSAIRFRLAEEKNGLLPGIHIVNFSYSVSRNLIKGKAFELSERQLMQKSKDDVIKVTINGLEGHLSKAFSQKIEATINGYNCKLSQFEINASKGKVKRGFLYGKIHLNGLGEKVFLPLQVALDVSGNVNVDATKNEKLLAFDANKKVLVSATVHRAFFNTHNKIQLIIDIDLIQNNIRSGLQGELEVLPNGTIKYINDLAYWPLLRVYKVRYGNFDCMITGMKLTGNKKGLRVVLSGILNLGRDIRGVNGPVRANLFLDFHFEAFREYQTESSETKATIAGLNKEPVDVWLTNKNLFCHGKLKLHQSYLSGTVHGCILMPDTLAFDGDFKVLNEKEHFWEISNLKKAKAVNSGKYLNFYSVNSLKGLVVNTYRNDEDVLSGSGVIRDEYKAQFEINATGAGKAACVRSVIEVNHQETKEEDVLIMTGDFSFFKSKDDSKSKSFKGKGKLYYDKGSNLFIANGNLANDMICTSSFFNISASSKKWHAEITFTNNDGSCNFYKGLKRIDLSPHHYELSFGGVVAAELESQTNLGEIKGTVNSYIDFRAKASISEELILKDAEFFLEDFGTLHLYKDGVEKDLFSAQISGPVSVKFGDEISMFGTLGGVLNTTGIKQRFNLKLTKGSFL